MLKFGSRGKQQFMLMNAVFRVQSCAGMLTPRGACASTIKYRVHIGIPLLLWLRRASEILLRRLCFFEGLLMRLHSMRGWNISSVLCSMKSTLWLWIMPPSIRVQRQQGWLPKRVRVYYFYRRILRSWTPLSRTSPTLSDAINTTLKHLLTKS